MTNQFKTSPIFFPKSIKGLEDAQDFAMINWHNSIDQAFDSITRFFNFSNDTFNTLSRIQNENLQRYFIAPTESSVKGRKKESPQEKTGREVDCGIAVVTGGIGGIGTAICRRLAGDNNQVIATYISAEEDDARSWQQERQQEGINAEIIECDVSDFESCKKTAERIESQFGRVDILVNCAGITRDAMLKKMDPESWHAVLDTNLDSIFNVTRNFVDGMISRKNGRIINISSVNGQKGQFGQTNYSSSKSGIIGFSRSLAVELADKGITVNSVCPGYVGTSMVEAIPEHVREAIISQIPAGRLARPEEIAHAVAFLASPDSAYITGTELGVNGGLWTG